jgi:hypothetical protein
MIDILKILNNDPDVKGLILSKLETALSVSENQCAEIRKILESVKGDSRPVAAPVKRFQAKKGGGSIPGSRGHREAIMAAVKAKPGMSVGELREALEKGKHQIGPRVLSTLLHVMSKEWTVSRGEKGLRTEGSRGSTTYWTK